MERIRPTGDDDLPPEEAVETLRKEQPTPAQRKLARSLLADQIWGGVTSQIIAEQKAIEQASLPRTEQKNEL